MDNNNIEINQEQEQQAQREQLRNDYEELQTHTLRTDVRLAENEQQQMAPQLREYHTVQSAREENIRIENLLSHAEDMNLQEAEQNDLRFRIRQNKNFEMVNTEKFGGDSNLMKAVKESVREVDTILQTKVGKAFDRQELLNNAIGAVSRAVANCDAYLARGRSMFFWRRKRFDLVTETKQRFEEDLEKLVQAVESDERDDALMEQEDTLMTLMNRPKISSRQGQMVDGDNELNASSVKRNLYGVGSFDYDLSFFKKNLTSRREINTGQKESPDRTKALVSFCMAEDRGILDGTNSEEHYRIYEQLSVNAFDNAAGNYTQEQKQKKVEALESFFEILMDYDIRNFDFDSYRDTLTSEKFRKNYLIAKAGWDADVLFTEYRNLLRDNKGLTLKYSAEDFAEIEAKRDTMGTISAYYDALEIYYTNKSLWTESLDDLMALSFNEIATRMDLAAGSNLTPVVNFYGSLMNIKGSGVDYNVHMSADNILQANRQNTINGFKLLAEEFKDDAEFTDIQKTQLKEKMIAKIKGDKEFPEIDPDVLPYEYLKSVVLMLEDKKPADAEYVKTVTDYMKDLMDGEDMAALSAEIDQMDSKARGDELRDLCVYALSYGSGAPELKKDSFQEIDTEMLRNLIRDKVTVAGLTIDENTKEDEKIRIAGICRGILIDHFKANEQDVNMLSAGKALSCVQRALRKVPDMAGIEEIIGGRFEILLDSFNGMEDMDADALSKLKETAVAEIRKGHEFNDFMLEGLPILAIKGVVQKLAQNNPSPKAFEEEVKKYARQFNDRQPLEACAEWVQQLNKKEEKTAMDNLDLREYALYYLLNNDLSKERFEKLNGLDTDTLKNMAPDKSAVMKLPEGGFKDIDGYRDAKALCVRCLTSYMGQKAEDIELLPANTLVELTKNAFRDYPDISRIPEKIAEKKASLIKEVLETEKKEAANSMFAESLYASADKKVEEKDEKKAALDAALSREEYITSILAHTKKYGSEADTKHLSGEQLRQIAIGTNLYVNLPADKLDRTMYKETFDEYTDDLAAVLAGAFGLEEKAIPQMKALGFDELFKTAGQMKDWLLDQKKYQEAKEKILSHLKAAKSKEAQKSTKEINTFLENPVYFEKIKTADSYQPKFKKEWSKEESDVLFLIGELTFTTNVTDEKGLAYSADKRVREVLSTDANAETVAMLMNENGKEKDTMTTLLNGMKRSEQTVVGGVGEVLKSIIARMKEQKSNSKWDAAAVKECLKDKSMDKFLADKDKDIEKAMQEGSKELQFNLDLVTETGLESAEDTIGDLIYDAPYVPKQATDKEKLDEIRDSIYKKDTANGRFLQKMMKDYYKYSTPEEQRFMMSYIIKELKPIQSSREYDMTRFSNYFTSMVKGAGPIMQKLMQGIPDRVVSPGVAAAVQASKSDLRPISEKYVDQVLERLKNESKGQVQSIMKLRSLGAASIAETFLCEITDNQGSKKQVVVKIKRPDAKMHIENEAKFLVKLANDADPTGVMGNSVTNHIQKVYEELDFRHEVNNALIGQSLYNGTDSKTQGTVRSVKINKDIPVGEDYIVMDKAEGVTLDRYIADIKKKYEAIMEPLTVTTESGKKRVVLTSANISSLNEVKEKLYKEMMSAQKHKEHVYRLAHKWCYEAFFDKYFHHGDLHSGNIMISDESATVLDYGNASKFTGEEIAPITKMTAAAGAKNTEIYVESMVELLAQEGIKVTDEQKETLKKKFCPIMALGTDKEAGKRIVVSILIAQESGIPVPRAIYNFAMCEQRLENSINEMNDIVRKMRSSFLDLDGTGLTVDVQQNDNPLVAYLRRYRRNFTAKKELQKSDSQLCDEMEEEYGLLDKQYYNDKLKTDNGSNDFANDFLAIHREAAVLYNANKSHFATIKKNKAKWLKEVESMKQMADDPTADQKALEARRNKLLNETKVLFERGVVDLLELYGNKNVAMFYQNAFVDLDKNTAEKYLNICTDELDLSLAAAKTGEKYISEKDAFFKLSSTKDANRDAFANVCQQYNSYKSSVSGPAVKQIDSLDPDSYDSLPVYRMSNTLDMLHDEIVEKDQNGQYKYNEAAQVIDQVYPQLKNSSPVEIEKRFKTDKQLQNLTRYFAYILDDKWKNSRKALYIVSRINSPEGTSFKKTYEAYNDVCDQYVREKYFGDGASEELRKKFKAAKAKLVTDYNAVIRSEIEKHRKYATIDPGTGFNDLADILTDEINDNGLKLLWRVGTDFKSKLIPDTPAYKAKYGVK